MERPSSWRNDEEGIMSERPAQTLFSPRSGGNSSVYGTDRTPGGGRKIASEISEEDLRAMMALHAGSFDSAPSPPRGHNRAAIPILSVPDNLPSTSHSPNNVSLVQMQGMQPITGIAPSTPTTLDSPMSSIGPQHDPPRSTQPLLSTSAKYRREFGRSADINYGTSAMPQGASSTVYSGMNTASEPSGRHTSWIEDEVRIDGFDREAASFYPDDTSYGGDITPPQSPSYTAHPDPYQVSIHGLIDRGVAYLGQHEKSTSTPNHPPKSPLSSPLTPISRPMYSSPAAAPGITTTGGSSRPPGRLRVTNATDVGSSHGVISDSEAENFTGKPYSPSYKRSKSKSSTSQPAKPLVFPPDDEHDDVGNTPGTSRHEPGSLVDLVSARDGRAHASHPSVEGRSNRSSVGIHDEDDFLGAPPPSYR